MLGTKRTGRWLRIGIAGPLAVSFCLLAAPAVRADDSTPADSAQTQASSTPAAQPQEAIAGSPAGTVAPSGQTAAATGSPAASQAGETAAESAQSAPDSQTQGTDAESTSPAAEPAQTSDTDDEGAAAADAPAAGEEAAEDAATGSSTGNEQEGSVTQQANAAATAEQQDVDNTEISVQIDDPGDSDPVSQANEAQADAEASADAATPDTTTSDQTANAAAEAAQTDVQNTAVNVRVGSPGDNATVEQANEATATASTSLTTPENGQGAAQQSATAAATQDGATNTNVAIRVFSPGDDGLVTQTNTAVAGAESTAPGAATAAATQSGAQNTNVSIRVGSPGSQGSTTQQSSTSADDGTAVGVTTGGLDTDISIVVDGDQLQQPGAGGLEVWEWTWVWDRDESQSVEDTLDGRPDSWDWAWGVANASSAGSPGAVRSNAPAGTTLQPGSWTWNWDWTREGAPNWTWDWDWQAQLPCASCVWIWNWSWNWTGQPAPTGSAAPQAQTTNTSETAEQANVVVAVAQATVTADVTQEIAQDGDGAVEHYAGQLVTIAQIADATAVAAQSDVETVQTANVFEAQLNRVLSSASATVRGAVEQRAEQTSLVDEDGDGSATVWSGQEVDLAQQARADVQATQQHISLRTGATVVAVGAASAAATADVDQRIVQDALVDAGTTDQWAGQLTLVEQVADALSVVEQTGAAMPRSVGGTARAQSSAGALARVDQGLVQRAARGGGVAAQTAMQAVYVGQNGSTIAMTTQQVGGAASSLASSDATATNRALVVQAGAQESTGVLGLDIQDLTQESIVVQAAVAVSISAGGIAGRAVVANCAIVEQTAGQSVGGGPGSPTSQDISAFCAPPVTGSSGETGSTSAAFAGSHVVVSDVMLAPPDEGGEAQLFHSSFHQRFSAAARRARATTPRVSLVRSGPDAERPATGSPVSTQISVPGPTQARFDTRPGDRQGAGNAGRKPPLPPAGDPPMWVSALVAATGSGTGPSGIAAIPDGFVLVPPVLLRAREGSVVRRPIDVLSQVDVPV